MPENEPANRVGPYQLLSSVGAGGMGEVWLAFDRERRTVAVKLLHAHLVNDAAMRGRLRREVETMRRIHHPSVAVVLDFDLEGDRPYLVTRYAQGRSLASLIRDDGPLKGTALLRLARDTAEALAAIHAAEVVHRDLKPANVMLDDGRPMIIDFSIAHAVDDSQLTRHGPRSGTYYYLAPELWRGGEAEPPVDVFAWAAMVGFAATGRHTFAARHEVAVRARIDGGDADLDGIDDGLRALLGAALAADPAARPAAAELVRRLRALENPPTRQTGRAEPTGPLGRVGPYRLTRVLGIGGMGEVHLAEDARGDRVAVKTLLPDLGDDLVVEQRLHREIAAMRRIRHPRVAEIRGFDLDHVPPYIASRYVDGRTLLEIVETDGPLTGDRLVRLALGLAEGLRAIHAAGIVHRDLKPGNVMVVGDEPVIIDFGIAHEIDATRLTQSGGRMGTLGYAAPEILRDARVGQPADVFAWACTIVFAATGRVAHPAPIAQAQRLRILDGQPDLDGVPEPLLAPVAEALAGAPGSRPTAEDLVRRLADHQPEPEGEAVSKADADPGPEAEAEPEYEYEDEHRDGPLPEVRSARDGAAMRAASAPGTPGAVSQAPPPGSASPAILAGGLAITPPGGEVIDDAAATAAGHPGGAAEGEAGEAGELDEADDDDADDDDDDDGDWLRLRPIDYGCIAGAVLALIGLYFIAMVPLDGRQNLRGFPMRAVQGSPPVPRKETCVLLGCLGDKQARSTELVYTLTIDRSAALTDFTVRGEGRRFLHIEPRLIFSSCPQISVGVRVMAWRDGRFTGRPASVLLDSRSGTRKVGYLEVGRPAVLRVQVWLTGSAPSRGCGAVVGLRNPYLHKLPSPFGPLVWNRELYRL